MVKWLAVIDKNGLIKLYPNKKPNINKKHGLQKVSLSPSKQKTFTIKKFLKQWKFWYRRYKYYRNTINKLITKIKNNHVKNNFPENCSNP